MEHSSELTNQVLTDSLQKIKVEGPLHVSTSNLDNLLDQICIILSKHEASISRLVDLEESHLTLGRNVKKLCLEQEEFKKNINNKSKAEVVRELNDKSFSTLLQQPSTRRSEIKELDYEIVEDFKEFTSGVHKEKLTAMMRDVIALRTLCDQMQSEVDCGSARSLASEKQLDMMRSEVFGLQRVVASAATVGNVKDLNQAIQRNHKEVKNLLETFELSLTAHVENRERQAEVQFKSLFREQDDVLKQKYDNLEKRLSSYSKLCEMKSLQDNFSIEVSDIRENINKIQDILVITRKSVKMTNQRDSILRICKLQNIWTRRLLKKRWQKWRQNVCRSLMLENAVITQARIFQGLLRRRIMVTLNYSFALWLGRIRHERKRERAMRRVKQMFLELMHTPMEQGFRMWRRTILMERDKSKNEEQDLIGLAGDSVPLLYDSTCSVSTETDMRSSSENDNFSTCSHHSSNNHAINTKETGRLFPPQSEVLYQPVEDCNSSSSDCLGDEQTDIDKEDQSLHVEVKARCVNDIIKIGNEEVLNEKETNQRILDMERVDHLNEIMKGLGSDTEGSFQVVIRELRRLRLNDLGAIRRSAASESQRSSNVVKAAIEMLLDEIKNSVGNLECQTNKKISSIENVIPSIESSLDKHKLDLEEVFARQSCAENGFNAKISSIIQYNDSTSEKLVRMKYDLDAANNKMLSSLQEQSSLRVKADKLEQRLEVSERENSDLKKTLDNIASRFSEEFVSIRGIIRENTCQISSLQEALREREVKFSTFKSESSKAFEKIFGRLNSQGVLKPKLSIILDDCIQYESVSFDKKFVVPLNSIHDASIERDVPTNIVNFAHDYAEWIAFQSDNETLQRIIIGSNPDEMVFCDDDVATRRKELLDELKQNFQTELEKRHSNPGAARLEARLKFIDRLMEATDTALSKHDQVLVSASTRIGRVKAPSAAVPTCVACDRPIRNKARRVKPSEVPETIPLKQEFPDENQVPSLNSNQSPDKQQQFVMRGGFKMPLSNNGSRPNTYADNLRGHSLRARSSVTIHPETR